MTETLPSTGVPYPDYWSPMSDSMISAGSAYNGQPDIPWPATPQGLEQTAALGHAAAVGEVTSEDLAIEKPSTIVSLREQSYHTAHGQHVADSERNFAEALRDPRAEPQPDPRPFYTYGQKPRYWEGVKPKQHIDPKEDGLNFLAEFLPRPEIQQPHRIPETWAEERTPWYQRVSASVRRGLAYVAEPAMPSLHNNLERAGTQLSSLVNGAATAVREARFDTSADRARLLREAQHIAERTLVQTATAGATVAGGIYNVVTSGMRAAWQERHHLIVPNLRAAVEPMNESWRQSAPAVDAAINAIGSATLDERLDRYRASIAARRLLNNAQRSGTKLASDIERLAEQAEETIHDLGYLAVDSALAVASAGERVARDIDGRTGISVRARHAAQTVDEALGITSRIEQIRQARAADRETTLHAYEQAMDVYRARPLAEAVFHTLSTDDRLPSTRFDIPLEASRVAFDTARMVRDQIDQGASRRVLSHLDEFANIDAVIAHALYDQGRIVQVVDADGAPQYVAELGKLDLEALRQTVLAYASSLDVPQVSYRAPLEDIATSTTDQVHAEAAAGPGLDVLVRNPNTGSNRFEFILRSNESGIERTYTLTRRNLTPEAARREAENYANGTSTYDKGEAGQWAIITMRNLGTVPQYDNARLTPTEIAEYRRNGYEVIDAASVASGELQTLTQPTVTYPLAHEVADDNSERITDVAIPALSREELEARASTVAQGIAALEALDSSNIGRLTDAIQGSGRTISRDDTRAYNRTIVDPIMTALTGEAASPEARIGMSVLPNQPLLRSALVRALADTYHNPALAEADLPRIQAEVVRAVERLGGADESFATEANGDEVDIEQPILQLVPSEHAPNTTTGRYAVTVKSPIAGVGEVTSIMAAASPEQAETRARELANLTGAQFIGVKPVFDDLDEQSAQQDTTPQIAARTAEEPTRRVYNTKPLASTELEAAASSPKSTIQLPAVIPVVSPTQDTPRPIAASNPFPTLDAAFPVEGEQPIRATRVPFFTEADLATVEPNPSAPSLQRPRVVRPLAEYALRRAEEVQNNAAQPRAVADQSAAYNTNTHTTSTLGWAHNSSTLPPEALLPSKVEPKEYDEDTGVTFTREVEEFDRLGLAQEPPKDLSQSELRQWYQEQVRAYYAQKPADLAGLYEVETPSTREQNTTPSERITAQFEAANADTPVEPEATQQQIISDAAANETVVPLQRPAKRSNTRRVQRAAHQGPARPRVYSKPRTSAAPQGQASGSQPDRHTLTSAFSSPRNSKPQADSGRVSAKEDAEVAPTDSAPIDPSNGKANMNRLLNSLLPNSRQGTDEAGNPIDLDEKEDWLR